MSHLDEGTLQAYLDHELAGRQRAVAAEHLLTCTLCREMLDALRSANATLAAALALVHVEPPARQPPVERSARSIRLRPGSLVRAAALVMGIAAVASATVPGSPVREWIVTVAAPAENAPVITSPPTAESLAAEPSGPVGVAIPVAAEAAVVVTGYQRGTLRLVRTSDGALSVSARDAAEDPAFRMGIERIEVTGGAGGEILVEVPDGVAVSLVVDGRTFAEVSGQSMTMTVPGERLDGGIVWR